MSSASSDAGNEEPVHVLTLSFICATFLTKLALGGNDFVILLPFMAAAADVRTKLAVAIQYVAAMLFLVGSAVAVALAFKAVASSVTHSVSADGKKHASHWLSVGSGVLLLVYSAYIWRTDSLEMSKEPGESDPLVGASSDASTSESPTQPLGSPLETVRKLGSKLPNLIVLALLGGADDFLVYLAIASGSMPAVSILCGVVLGCIVIAIGCALITEIEVVSRYIAMVPPWLVVALLGLYLIVSPFL
jgi:hypothetical protein